jgi:glutaredoxin 3
MKRVTVYTTTYCGYCHRAKAILREHGVPYEERDVTHDANKREWLVETTGMRTVPQIFFDDEPIGGCDDLEVIVDNGELAARLTSPLEASAE